MLGLIQGPRHGVALQVQLPRSVPAKHAQHLDIIDWTHSQMDLPSHRATLVALLRTPYGWARPDVASAEGAFLLRDLLYLINVKRFSPPSIHCAVERRRQLMRRRLG